MSRSDGNGVARSAPVAPDPATTAGELRETAIGSVFVSNYPPYSFWSPEHLADFEQALQLPPRPATELGLYIHIPFCRRRCRFCYFKVYTDKNADQVREYIDALDAELQRYRDLPAVAGRNLEFVYFGGGTPSYISAKQLEDLVARLKGSIPWDTASEVAFECEPGTLSQSKIEAIRAIGVTRLSLGVENFEDRILELNGRAHVSKEIGRVRPWIQEAGFAQVNIDIIAGMIGETWETWRQTVQRAIDYGADSVTVYQMEVPYNTSFSQQVREGSLELPLADWDTKREWNDYALEQLAANGYELSSAYTMTKSDSAAPPFVYRDALWHGADMLGIGVSSFGHISGVHVQNISGWGGYLERVGQGELPVQRAYATSAEERSTREMILQLKTGSVAAGYFHEKFGVDIIDRYRAVLETLQQDGQLRVEGDSIVLTRKGLLRVDSMLPSFYSPRFQHARYS